MKRKQYTPEFKAKVVLQVLREEKTLGEIAADWSAPDLWSSFKVSPNRFYEAFRFSSDTSITFQTDLRNASVISRSSNVYV